MFGATAGFGTCATASWNCGLNGWPFGSISSMSTKSWTSIARVFSGASAEIRSYSYFKQNELTGLYTRRRGRQSIDLSVPCVVAGSEGNRVRDLLARVLDVPVAMEASALAQFAWLSTVGFVTGRIGAPSKGFVEIDFRIKGNP